MTERKFPRPSGDVVDDGVPATEEVRDERLLIDDPGVADMPMPDEPVGADEWGVTEFEERTGEPLDHRLGRETPEREVSGDAPGERFSEPRADEADYGDNYGDMDYGDMEGASVADRDVGRYDSLTAEEAAMHVVDEDHL